MVITSTIEAAIKIFHCSQNKKLSCRRKAARCFVTLKVLLSNSRSFKVIEMAPIDRSYVCHCKYSSISVTVSSYWMLKKIVTLKSTLGPTQGHRKWHHSKAWVWFPIRIKFCSNYGRIFSRFDTVHECDKHPARQTDKHLTTAKQRPRLCMPSYTIVVLLMTMTSAVLWLPAPVGG